MTAITSLYLLVIFLFHFSFESVRSEDYLGGDLDEDYDYECNHLKYVQKCAYDDFFNQIKKLQDLPELKNKNAKFCCSAHGFLYEHPCEGEHEDKHVCGIESNATQEIVAHAYSLSTPCPKGCVEYKSQRLSNSIFVLNSDGTLSLNETNEYVKHFSVKDYCIGYICDDIQQEWIPAVDVCVCYDDEILDTKYDRKVYKRCCDDGFMKANHDDTEITCISNPTDKESKDSSEISVNVNCNKSFDQRKIHGFGKNDIAEKLDKYIGKLGNNGTFLNLSYQNSTDGKKNLTLELKGDYYCIGMNVEMGGSSTSGNPLENFGLFPPILAYCPSAMKPCNGKIPCINTCGCPRSSQMLLPSGKCTDVSEKVSEQLLNNYGRPLKDHAKLFKDEIFNDISLDNLRRLYMSNEMIDHVSCPDGWHTMNSFDPCSNSDETFMIGFNTTSNKTLLVANNMDKNFTDYCLVINNDLTYSAHVCRENKLTLSAKDRFNIAFLVISSILLIITLGVYTKYKQLLTEYTRLMRHFAFVLLITYIVMIINKLVHLGDDVDPGICQFSAYFLHYLFVCSFSLMSSMAVFTWNKIRSHSMEGRLSKFYGTEERFQVILVMFSYGSSFLMTLITLIAEFTSPKCATYRPKFGGKGGSCFFNERIAKGIWLFIPMGISLMINFGVFITVLSAIWKKKRAVAKIQGKAKKDEPLVPQAYMYLKMFLGMGFVWIVEIISGLSGDSVHEAAWYVFDAINSLQGLWVFLIFVCRPDAYRKIMRTTGLDTVFTSATKSKAGKIKMKNLKPGQRLINERSGSDGASSSLMPSGQIGGQTAFTNVSTG